MHAPLCVYQHVARFQVAMIKLERMNVRQGIGNRDDNFGCFSEFEPSLQEPLPQVVPFDEFLHEIRRIGITYCTFGNILILRDYC